MLIAQLSDPHVRPEGLLYQGVVDSNAMFAAAIAHLGGLDPRPDLLLLSGDLVDRGEPAEYARLRRLLASLDVPALVIPGNHDDRETFRQAFRDHSYLPDGGPMHYVAGSYGEVRIVALDVTLPGLHHGDIDEGSMLWLDGALSAEPRRPTIVMMHQPPFDCGVPYLDAYHCRNGARFGGTVLCTAPSTTTAIALRLKPDARPASYVEPPACLLHHWRPGAGLITHFSPIGTFPGPYPFA